MRSLNIFKPKEEVYTIKEFLALSHEEEISKLDKAIGHIKRNKKMYRKLVFVTACLLTSNTMPIFATSSFDAAGMELFDIVVGVAKWIFIAKGGWEIIQKMSTGADVGDISGIVAKYGMGYGSIIMLPRIMNILSSALSKIGGY